MRTVPFGRYEGRTVKDVTILDPVWLLIQHEAGSYILTDRELDAALRAVDESGDDTCGCDDT